MLSGLQDVTRGALLPSVGSLQLDLPLAASLGELGLAVLSKMDSYTPFLLSTSAMLLWDQCLDRETAR